MSRRNRSALGWAKTPNVFVDIKCKFTMKNILAKNSILLVRNACVRSSNMSQQGLKRLECIGLSEEKTLTLILGDPHASINFVIHRCKHTTEEHSCNYPLKCKKCSCYDFNSNFACLTCDGLWEHHEVLYETADERKMLKKPIGQ